MRTAVHSEVRMLRTQVLLILAGCLVAIGLLWALVVAGVTIFWFGDTTLGLIAGTAIVINLVAAAAAGASIPLILRRLQIDPALAGCVILTTVTDVVGFVTFLGLGTLFLMP